MFNQIKITVGFFEITITGKNISHFIEIQKGGIVEKDNNLH